MRLIIHKPIITEKSLKDAGRGIYTFEVEKDAGKTQITKVIENMFSVHVKSISTSIIKGKVKTAGRKRNKIRLSDRKKAMVTLKNGEKIPLFDTVQSK